MDFKDFMNTDKSAPDKILNFQDYLSTQKVVEPIVEPITEPVVEPVVDIIEPIEPQV